MEKIKTALLVEVLEAVTAGRVDFDIRLKAGTLLKQLENRGAIRKRPPNDH